MLLRTQRNVFVISFTVFLILVSLFSWLYIFPLYLKELGASDKNIGLLYTLFGFGFTLAQIYGGHLSDRFGRKWVIVIPTYTFPLCYLLVGLSKSWWVAGIFYLLINIGSAIQVPSFTSIIAESTQERGRAFGVFEFSAALGVAIGPLMGSFLISRLGVRPLILITAGFCGIAGLIRHLFLEETRRGIIRGVGFKKQLNANLIWFLLSAVFMFLVLSLTIYGPFLALFQKESLNFTEGRINLLFGIANLFAALLSLLGGKLVQNFGYKKVLLIGLLFHPLLILIWSLSRGFSPFFILSFSFSQFAFISYQVGIADLTEERTRARVIGLFGTLTGLVSSIGPFIGMELKLRFGSIIPFYLAMLFGLIAMIFLSKMQESITTDRRR